MDELHERLAAWWTDHVGLLVGRLRRCGTYEDAVDAVQTSIEELWPRLCQEGVVHQENEDFFVGNLPLLDYLTNRARQRIRDGQRRRQVESAARENLASEVADTELPPEPGVDAAHAAAFRQTITCHVRGLESLQHRCALLNALRQAPEEILVPEITDLLTQLEETVTPEEMTTWLQRPAVTRRSDLRRMRLALRQHLLAHGAAYADLLPAIDRLAPDPAGSKGGCGHET